MKRKYLLITTVFLLAGLTGCHKVSIAPDPVAGTWREVKLRLYELVNDTIKYDTTYYQPFTNFDYITFNNNGTCMAGQDHYYYDNSPGLPKTPQAIPPVIGEFDYSSTGSSYVLTYPPGPVNPGGFVITDTVFTAGPDTLRQQVMNYGHGTNPVEIVVTQAYYFK